MNTNALKFLTLASLLPFCSLMSMRGEKTYDGEETKKSTLNWTSSLKGACNRTFNAVAQTVNQSPLEVAFAGFYLAFDRKAIKENTFLAGALGCCLLGKFAKNLISPEAPFKNFILKTAFENPMFTYLSAYMLSLHRNSISNYPVLTTLVCGTLLSKLAENYQRKTAK